MAMLSVLFRHPSLQGSAAPPTFRSQTSMPMMTPARLGVQPPPNLPPLFSNASGLQRAPSSTGGAWQGTGRY
jgi:hypothetical protein